MILYLNVIYIGATVYSSSTQLFGESTGPILFTNIRCSGTESRLLECSRSGFGVTSCTHSRDVGVKCDGNEYTSYSRMLLV